MSPADLNKVLACIDRHGPNIEALKENLVELFGKKRSKLQTHGHPLLIYITTNYPYVAQLVQPTFDQCEALKKKYHHLLIIEKLEAMENRKTLLKDYQSLFLTLKNWCNMALKNGWTPPESTSSSNLKKYE